MSFSFSFVFIICICLNITQQTCNTQNQINEFNVGDQVVICLILINSNKYMAFKVKVDQYSSLFLDKGIYVLIAYQYSQAIEQIKLQVQNSEIDGLPNYVQNILQNYRIKENFANIFSFIIRLNDGKVVQIENDNSCEFCQCEKDKCKCQKYQKQVKIQGRQKKFEYTNCYYNDDQQNKNPRIFISWIGKDKKGYHMRSHAQRIARFRQYAIGNIDIGSLYNSL